MQDKGKLIGEVIAAASDILVFKLEDFIDPRRVGTEVAYKNFYDQEELLRTLFGTCDRIVTQGRSHLMFFTNEELENAKAALRNLSPFLDKMRRCLIDGKNSGRNEYELVKQEAAENFEIAYRNFSNIISPFNERISLLVIRDNDASLRENLSRMVEKVDNLSAVRGEIEKVKLTLGRSSDVAVSKVTVKFSKHYAELSTTFGEDAAKWLGFIKWYLPVIVTAVILYAIFCPFKATDWMGFASHMAIQLFIFGIFSSVIYWSFRNYSILKHNQALNKHKALALETFSEFTLDTAFDAPIRTIVVERVSRTIFEVDEFGYLSEEPTPKTDPVSMIEAVSKLLPEKK